MWWQGILTAVAAGLFAGSINFVFWFLFIRVVRENGEQLVTLNNRVVDLEDHKIAGIEKAVEGNAAEIKKVGAESYRGRKSLHEKIERETLSPRTFDAVVKRFESSMNTVVENSQRASAEASLAHRKVENIAGKVEVTLDRINKEKS